jgi:hypothetical protein
MPEGLHAKPAVHRAGTAPPATMVLSMLSVAQQPTAAGFPSPESQHTSNASASTNRRWWAIMVGVTRMPSEIRAAGGAVCVCVCVGGVGWGGVGGGG